MNYVIINNSISYLALKFILGDKFLSFRLQTTNEKLIRTCKTTSNSLTVNIFTDLLKTYLMKSTAYEIKITTNRFTVLQRISNNSIQCSTLQVAMSKPSDGKHIKLKRCLCYSLQNATTFLIITINRANDTVKTS